MAKKIDPKAKAKRQKIYAGIGGVILLALLAFQVPRTLKMMNPPSDASASSSTTPAATATTPLAAPSLSGGNATAAAPTGGDGLVDSDAPPPPQSGQLLAFGLFRTKDPFKQQLAVDGATGSAGATPSTGSTGSTGAKPSATPTSGAGNAGGSGSGSGSGRGNGSTVVQVATPAAAAVTTAEISVNGVAQTVQVGGVFPSSDPFFKLVKVTRKSAKISIAGGTLANGAPTVTLTKAKPLTLQNTSDGTRYVLRLLSVS